MNATYGYAIGLLALALASTGCLHVSKNLLEPIEAPDPAPHKPFVEYQISPNFEVGTPGGGYIKLATNTKIGRGIMGRMLKRWERAGYISGFAYINPKEGDFTPRSDFRLILAGSARAESSAGLQILSGLTLMVIPAYGEVTYDLILWGERTDRRGCRFEAQAEDGIEEWFQILLLPAMPFAPVADSRTDTRLSRHLYQQLERQGAFALPAESRATDPSVTPTAGLPAEETETGAATEGANPREAPPIAPPGAPIGPALPLCS